MDRRGGFTLVELLILVLCVGIAAAAALPGLGNLVTEQRVDAAASGIAGALRFAQSEAIRTAGPVGVEIRARCLPVEANGYDDGNWFRVFDAADLAKPDLVNPMTGRPFVRDLDDGAPGGEGWIKAVRAGAGIEIVFDAYGEPLVTDGEVVVEAGSESRTIDVFPVTGRVTVTPS